MATIKKFILLALTTLMMVGCEESKPVKTDNSYKIIIIDSCEYIEAKIAGYSSGTFPLHKNNCRFCKERRQKELEELIEQLKEK